MRWSPLLFALTWALLDASHGSAQSPASEAALATAVRAIVSARAPAGAQVGVSVMLAELGRPIIDEGAARAMNPASNAKVITAAAALGLLGTAATFVTTVSGRIDGDTVRELALVGGGDPALRARDLDALASELASRGVRRVDGALTLDDTRYGGELLPPAFEQQPMEDAGFRPSVSALAVDAGAFSVNLLGGAVGAPCGVWALPPEAASLSGSAVTASSGAPLLRLDAGASAQTAVSVGGTCAPGMTVLRRRQSHPTLVAGEAFAAALRRYGVRVEGPLRVGAVMGSVSPLVVHRSPALGSILDDAGKSSSNFTAELLLLAVAPPESRTSEAGAARVLGWLRERGVRTEGMVLRNGSGLFDANRASPRQLTEVLRVGWRDPRWRHEFVSQLAVAGEDGTLLHRLQGSSTRGLVRAKTGTLDDVVALSGFVLAPQSSRTLVFSVVVNGCRSNAAQARAMVDELVTALARHVRAGR